MPVAVFHGPYHLMGAKTYRFIAVVTTMEQATGGIDYVSP